MHGNLLRQSADRVNKAILRIAVFSIFGHALRPGHDNFEVAPEQTFNDVGQKSASGTRCAMFDRLLRQRMFIRRASMCST
jgi:hypothetical protein